MAGYITEGAELLVWTDDGWLAEVDVWVRERLDELGRDVDGEIEQIQVRPWGSVLRASTSSGAAFFKASTDLFEAPLTRAIADWAPRATVPVLAVDTERNWILTGEAGTRFCDLGQTEDALRRWEHALGAYAELQRTLVERRTELLAIGLPDQRLDTLPEQYARAVDEIRDLTDDERGRLRVLGPRFAEMCDELASLGIPSTLQHDEVHEGHVVLRGDGGYAFFDWAEAVVSHPFLTLRGTLFSLAEFFVTEREDARLRRLVDVYLERWTAEAPKARLVEAFALVDPIGAVCRALRWHAFVQRMGPPFAERYGHAPAAILRRFFDAV